MAIHLYCLTSAAVDGPPASLRGVDDHPVRAVSVGGARVWVSDLMGTAVPTVERVRAHDRVVREAMREETPLPVRFGQSFADEAALRDWLSARDRAIVAALGRVSGLLEMTVRVRLSRQRPGKLKRSKELTGRGYLQALRDREREESAMREEAEFLHARVARAVAEAEIACGESSEVSAGEGMLVLSHLIRRGADSRYRQLVRAALDHDPAHPVMISGPWAPYSFAERIDE